MITTRTVLSNNSFLSFRAWTYLHYLLWIGFRTPQILSIIGSSTLFLPQDCLWWSACHGSLMESASVNTCPFPCNKETKVNAFDHSDISEWNEEEMERWQLGQIASKIEHDKPLNVISMWTFGGRSVYDDREYEWIWNSSERGAVERNRHKGEYISECNMHIQWSLRVCKPLRISSISA